MDVLEIPVTLIVKAPNQQVEDQTIHCSLSWTIKRLKGYLSEVYPSKPNTEDQRLIYYGQLLSDSVTLKDVFTRYEAGQETHTVHLVCMPSKETLRRRTVMGGGNERTGETGAASSSAATDSGRLEGSSSATSSSANTTTNIPQQRLAYPSAVQPPDASSYMQHLAWMQRMYAQHYMTQYMDMMARQHGLGGLQEGYMDPQRFRQRFRQEAEPVEQEARQPAAPAAVVEGAAEDDENRANRDWLDYFYLLSRVMVLFSIVIFYSSPARFIIVSALGIVLYLYQVGFFRLNQLQALENNEAVNNNNNNNIPAENNNMGEPPPAGPQDAGARVEAQQEERQHTPETPAAPAPDALGAPQRPSFMAVTWTFLTSFFASLIPETQNAI